MRFEHKRKGGWSQFEPVRKILTLNYIVDISNNADHVERPIYGHERCYVKTAISSDSYVVFKCEYMFLINDEIFKVFSYIISHNGLFVYAFVTFS